MLHNPPVPILHGTSLCIWQRNRRRQVPQVDLALVSRVAVEMFCLQLAGMTEHRSPSSLGKPTQETAAREIIVEIFEQISDCSRRRS
jgi:hypothetical protein